MASGSVESGLKFVPTTTVLGRKRVMACQALQSSNLSSFSQLGASPLKRQNSGLEMERRSNHIEALPQDIMLKILCKVDHSDLKQLLLVSKSFNQASFIAKELHFAFSTPTSKSGFRNLSDAEGSELAEEDGGETPNAPKQERVAKSRLAGKRLSSLAVFLFASDPAREDYQWQKNGLAAEMDDVNTMKIARVVSVNNF